MYEFSAGTVPYAHPEDENPQYRSHDFKDSAAESLVMGLLDQDHNVRLGCDSRGIAGARSVTYDHPNLTQIACRLPPIASPIASLIASLVASLIASRIACRDPRPSVLEGHRLGPRAAQKVRLAVRQPQGAGEAQEGQGEPRRADRQ